MNTAQDLALSARGRFSGTALQFKDKTMSYEEFDREADRFCQVLLSLGIGPGKTVILKMHPSMELVTAMFGIIRSGAALVPIASSTPEKRCESIRLTSSASLMVDEEFYESHAADVPPEAEIKMAAEDDPGIILYTSGSTGTPKGVLQSQSSAGFLFNQFPYHLQSTGIQINEFDTILARLNYAFIVAYHYEYPVALLNGKKLVIMTESEQGSILDTSEYIEKNPKSFMAILPSQLALYLENERFCHAMKNLSGLGFFAEPASEMLLNKLMENEEFTGSISTVYGSTETFGVGWRDFRNDRGMVPSPEVEIRVSSEDNKELKPGERGDITVCSPTTFMKYLTEEKDRAEELFASKSFTADGKRYVKTGDLGYLTAEGSLVLLGRSDRMVKYHGQRVELAEVETTVKNHPSIRNCCAVLKKDNNGNFALIAYYEGEQDQDIDSREMRKYLIERVPAYMIPMYYKRLEHIPLNANGKIDFRAVEKLDFDFSKTNDAEGNHDLTETEQMIADCAGRLLKITPDQFVRESNLMAMGIDSLNSVILINELAEKGYQLSVDDFVTSETLAELAERLRIREKDTGEDKDVSELVLCTDMQKFWIDNEFQVVANIVCHRGIDEEELKRKSENCSRIHPVLRSSFVEIDGEMHTKVLKERPISWSFYDIRNLGDGTEEFSSKQASFINLHSFALFHQWDINNYLTVIGIRTHDRKTVICIRFDHRVVDGMSEKLLFNEFITADEIKEKDNYISYLNYTGSKKACDEASAFWKKYLEGVEPKCMPYNPNPTGNKNVRQYRISLGKERTEQIRENCKRENVSLSAYTLFQYGRALMDVLGKDDIIMDLGVSGRSVGIPGMNKTIGCLVNAVPVRIRRGDTPKDFMHSYLQADRYGFYPAKRIYKECFGLDYVPKLNPYIVSQIFPQGLVEDAWEYYETPSFEQFPFGEFLWEDGDGLHMVWHPDVDFWEEKCLDEVEKTLEKYLLQDLY